MSIKQNQGFLLQSPVPTVLRDAVDTIVDLKNINDNYYPDNYIVLCNEDNTVYLYTKSNSIDATTGKCRKLVNPETSFDAFPIESNTSAVYSDGLYKWFKGYGDWDLGKTYTYKTSNSTRAPLVKRYDHKNVTSPTQKSLFVTYDAAYTPYLSKTIHYDCTGTRNQDYYAVFCAPSSSAGAIKFDFTVTTLSGSSTDPDWSKGNSITCMFDTNHDRVSFASLPKGFDIIASSVVGDQYTIAMKIPAAYTGHLYFRTTGYFNDNNNTGKITFMGASVLNDSVTWSFIRYDTLVDNLTTYDIVTYEQLQEVPSFGTGSSILNYSLINSEHINIIEENTGSNSKTFNWAMDRAIYYSLWDKFTYLDTSKQSTLIAGNNIAITNGNVISAYVEATDINLVNGSASGSLRQINSSEETVDYSIGINASTFGQSTKGIGAKSFCVGGYNNTVFGENSVIAGSNNSLTTPNSFILGTNNTCSSSLSMGNNIIFGNQNTNSGNGWCNFITGKSNTLTTKDNANFINGDSNTIQDVTPITAFSATSYATFISGISNIATGCSYSSILGCYHDASNLEDSLIVGKGITANEVKHSIIFGNDFSASTVFSSFVGGFQNNISYLDFSSILGTGITANGTSESKLRNCFACGTLLTLSNNQEVALGKGNISTLKTESSAGTIFSIGNGSDARPSETYNALEVRSNDAIYISSGTNIETNSQILLQDYIGTPMTESEINAILI